MDQPMTSLPTQAWPHFVGRLRALSLPRPSILAAFSVSLDPGIGDAGTGGHVLGGEWMCLYHSVPLTGFRANVP